MTRDEIEGLPTPETMNVLALTQRLEKSYQFECEAGPLKNCVDWQNLKSGIETTIDILNKIKNEFDVAGKPARYIGRIYVNTALSALKQMEEGTCAK